MKSFRGAFTTVFTILTILLLSTLPLLSAEGAEPDPADSSAGLIFRWLNFFIVFGGGGYLIAKHGGGFFRGNAKAIAASITEAQAAKAEADRELRGTQEKIANLDHEVAQMHEAARGESLAEAERLRASGEAEIQKIQTAARAELQAAERAAQQELRNAAASMSVERAAAIVRSRMNPAVRARIMQDFVQELERSAH